MPAQAVIPATVTLDGELFADMLAGLELVEEFAQYITGTAPAIERIQDARSALLVSAFPEDNRDAAEFCHEVKLRRLALAREFASDFVRSVSIGVEDA